MCACEPQLTTIMSTHQVQETVAASLKALVPELLKTLKSHAHATASASPAPTIKNASVEQISPKPDRKVATSTNKLLCNHHRSKCMTCNWCQMCCMRKTRDGEIQYHDFQDAASRNYMRYKHKKKALDVERNESAAMAQELRDKDEHIRDLKRMLNESNRRNRLRMLMDDDWD